MPASLFVLQHTVSHDMSPCTTCMQIEVHMLHTYPEDFHGFEVRVMVTGFIRPELKFDSIGALVDRIQRDISIAKVQLQHEWSMSWKDDNLFSQIS